MKKVLKITFFILLTAAVICLAGMLKSWLMPPENILPEYAQITSGKDAVSPGGVVDFRAALTLPENVKIVNTVLHASGIKNSEIAARFKSWRWDRNHWEVSGNFRVFDNGDIRDGRIEITTADIFAPASGSVLTVKIPEISVKLPENTVTGEELFLAPETEAPGETPHTPFYRRTPFYLIVAATVLLIAAVIISIIFLHRKKQHSLPLETVVIRDIQQLNGQVKNGDIRPEHAFALLCDILRSYLEKRFALPVTRSTTEEFLRSMDIGALLPERREQLFLTGFLNSADLIKFAGANADKLMFDRAAAQAAELVLAATPKEEKQ
ncbi:MAG: hypothetical protein E7058_01680 [Lentisphaerae bacterium]|nr:hypothetical protein [Lentisphaerota bacterium]